MTGKTISILEFFIIIIILMAICIVSIPTLLRSSDIQREIKSEILKIYPDEKITPELIAHIKEFRSSSGLSTKESVKTCLHVKDEISGIIANKYSFLLDPIYPVSRQFFLFIVSPETGEITTIQVIMETYNKYDKKDAFS